MSQGRHSIDHICLPSGGRIGMIACPGRSGLLDDELATLHHWGADVLLTLIEPVETVGELERAAARCGLAWRHLPIGDMQPPGPAAFDAWGRCGDELLDILDGGGTLVIHCAAGLGRTGTVAAALLVARGFQPGEAVRLVRAARPGAIETEEQLAFVLSGASFGRPAAPQLVTAHRTANAARGAVEGTCGWRAQLDALVFAPAGHDGVCAVHRLAFRAMIGPDPRPAACASYFARHWAAFEEAAHRKILRRGLDPTVSLHLNSRDIRTALARPAQPLEEPAAHAAEHQPE